MEAVFARKPNLYQVTQFRVLKETFDGHESRAHCHDTVLRYMVTLQVCTHLKARGNVTGVYPP
jgi:hypothetical protein